MRKTVTDGALGVGGVSTPIWLHWTNEGIAIILGLLGGALLIFRCLLAWKELREKRDKQ